MKILKQIMVVVAIFFIAATTSFAQSYTHAPGDTILISINLEELKVLTIKQVHTSPDTLLLAWQKIFVSKPATWEVSLCDYGYCFTALPDSGNMDPIVPGDDGLMSLHAKAHDTNGTAIIRYAIWDRNNTTHRDTLTWVINSYTTAINDPAKNTPIIYSYKKRICIDNPNLNYTHLVVYDLSGKAVLNEQLPSDRMSFDLSFANEGFYIAELIGNGENKRQKLFLSN
jgi:hypothetical protein